MGCFPRSSDWKAGEELGGEPGALRELSPGGLTVLAAHGVGGGAGWGRGRDWGRLRFVTCEERMVASFTGGDPGRGAGSGMER